MNIDLNLINLNIIKLYQMKTNNLLKILIKIFLIMNMDFWFILIDLNNLNH